MVHLRRSGVRPQPFAAPTHTSTTRELESWDAGTDWPGHETTNAVCRPACVNNSVGTSLGRLSRGIEQTPCIGSPTPTSPRSGSTLAAVRPVAVNGTAAANLHVPDAATTSAADVERVDDRTSLLDTVCETLGLTVHEGALVWPTAISTEAEQQRLIEATIRTADRMAAITTYSVRPVHHNQLSKTMEAVCRGIAERQDDTDFTLFFLYNRQILAHTLAVGRRTEASLSKPITWTRAFEAYNAGVAAGEIPGKPIKRLACRVVLLEVEPQRLCGSWHNKFYINDRGFFATGGWSTANRSKPTWFDCGIVALHAALCQQQWSFFASHMLRQASRRGAAARVVMSQAGDRLGFELKSLGRDALAACRRRCADLQVASPHLQTNGRDSTVQELSRLLPVAARPVPARVSVAQNKGRFYTPFSRCIRDRPATRLLASLIAAAAPGDTLSCRDESLDPIVIPMFVDALRRGAKVRLLLPANRRADARNYGVLRDIFRRARQHHADAGLEFKIFRPSTELMDLHGYRRVELGPPTDHAKVYCFRPRSGPDVAVIGTLNLDRQSWLGSNEIVAAVEHDAASISSAHGRHPEFDMAGAVFDDFWDASGPVLRYDDAVRAHQLARFDAQTGHGHRYGRRTGRNRIPPMTQREPSAYIQ